MGLRHVARTVNFSIHHTMAVALLAMPLTNLTADEPNASTASEGAQVRITTYQSESGDGYFAASRSI